MYSLIMITILPYYPIGYQVYLSKYPTMYYNTYTTELL